MPTPVGTRAWRETRAIQLYFTTSKTQAEIADELGVSRQTANEYVNSPPAAEVQEWLAEKQAEVRVAALEELLSDLQDVREQARTAEKPVPVWRDENGELDVVEVRDDRGTVVERKAVAQDVTMGPDTDERFFRRQEKREILEDIRELVGADAPEDMRVQLTGDGGGPVVLEAEATVPDEAVAAVIASSKDRLDNPDTDTPATGSTSGPTGPTGPTGSTSPPVAPEPEPSPKPDPEPEPDTLDDLDGAGGADSTDGTDTDTASEEHEREQEQEQQDEDEEPVHVDTGVEDLTNGSGGSGWS